MTTTTRESLTSHIGQNHRTPYGDLLFGFQLLDEVGWSVAGVKFKNGQVMDVVVSPRHGHRYHAIIKLAQIHRERVQGSTTTTASETKPARLIPEPLKPIAVEQHPCEACGSDATSLNYGVDNRGNERWQTTCTNSGCR